MVILEKSVVASVSQMNCQNIPSYHGNSQRTVSCFNHGYQEAFSHLNGVRHTPAQFIVFICQNSTLRLAQRSV